MTGIHLPKLIFFARHFLMSSPKIFLKCRDFAMELGDLLCLFFDDVLFMMQSILKIAILAVHP